MAPDGGFVALGLSRRGWASGDRVREIFRNAFAVADLPYFNPHSFRAMLVRHAMTMNLSAEQMKALSQNLGHSEVLTTFTSYGAVPVHRQGQLIRAISAASTTGGSANSEQVAALEGLLASLKAGSVQGLRPTSTDG